MKAPVTVKFVAKGMKAGDSRLWLRQIPGFKGIGVDGVWQSCRFIVDPELTQYDWLVVYDDLPPSANERLSTRIEKLACPAQNTIFVTAEPSIIKNYGHDFLDQFGMILSCQTDVPHPHHKTTFHIPGLRWYYGVPMDWKKDQNNLLTFDELLKHHPIHKTKGITTLCSTKNMRHTLHNKRIAFTFALQKLLPEIEIFGHGRHPLNDKKEAIDDYRYHLAIENSIAPHYITEKLTDAYLGLSLPFYIGAPNAGDYFPEESFIALDLENPALAAKTIQSAIKNNLYAQRLPALIEARRRVMQDYNIFSMIEKMICNVDHPNQMNEFSPKRTIMSRHAFYQDHPVAATKLIFQKLKRHFRRHF